MTAVIVTGGGAGIGAAVASHLAVAGATVVVADANAAAATAVARELGCDAVTLDVTEPHSVEETFAAIAKKHGGLAGLVNCAGLSRVGPSMDFAANDWAAVLNVNLSGTFYACRAAARHMSAGGAIVNLTSIAAVRARAGRAAYSASKAGVVGLTKALAVEWAPLGIRVNAIGPGPTKTDMLVRLMATDGVTEDEAARNIPLGRLGTVDDICGSVSFMLSDKASFVTGQTLYVDGGWTWAR